jgi:hypothetical protein
MILQHVLLRICLCRTCKLQCRRCSHSWSVIDNGCILVQFISVGLRYSAIIIASPVVSGWWGNWNSNAVVDWGWWGAGTLSTS